MRSIIILAAIPVALLFQGCGPSAKQLAEQKAIREFREAIAAVKVCTQDTTYQEFREKRLALETRYTANQSYLSKQSNEIDQLIQTMEATDLLWNYELTDDAEITSQEYIDIIARVKDTLQGFSDLSEIVPANTALGAMDQKAAAAKSQLDYLYPLRDKFRILPDYLAGNPQARSTYDQLFGDIKTEPLPAGCRPSQWNTPLWQAMLIINPSVATKANFTPDQCRNDPDFLCANYSKMGLLLISKDCDQLLTEK